jgi:hypothetical protein
MTTTKMNIQNYLETQRAKSLQKIIIRLLPKSLLHVFPWLTFNNLLNHIFHRHL